MKLWQPYILNSILLVAHLALTHPKYWKPKGSSASGKLPSLRAV